MSLSGVYLPLKVKIGDVLPSVSGDVHSQCRRLKIGPHLHINSSEYMDQLYKVGYRRHDENSDLICVAQNRPGLP